MATEELTGRTTGARSSVCVVFSTEQALGRVMVVAEEEEEEEELQRDFALSVIHEEESLSAQLRAQLFKSGVP